MKSTSPSAASRGRFAMATSVTLALCYVVIIAGSVVRSTGAGMGCPDWPKCFGHYVPPTHVSELQYEQGRAFKAGHFIIHDNALWKARHDLVATGAIDLGDWEKYTKHDYAVFNAAHTWTEYGNRLSGVLLGISAIVMVAISFGRRKWDRTSVIASIVALLLITFEGWLGALVVESKLAPVKITTHMVVALVIVALMVWIVRRARAGNETLPALSRTTAALLLGGLLLTITQILLGTQVREQVDLVAQAMGEAARAKWIDDLGGAFLVHRSFAWALLVIDAIAIQRILKEARGFSRMQRRAAMLAGLVLASVASGIVLQEAMPAAAQPVHLLLATLMFGLQFGMLLDTRRRTAAPEPAPTPLPTERRPLGEPA